MENRVRQPPVKNIILAGNPNVGKSTVFNRLTGKNQHTGNWTGKTVEFSSAVFEYKNITYKVTDLPGTYSLMSDSPDEEVARDYLIGHKDDTVIVVADANALERNLNLIIQIKEMCKNVIIAVNLMDEAERNGLRIDLAALDGLLDISAVGITASKKHGINPLLGLLASESYLGRNNTDTLYDIDIERALDTLTPLTRSRYAALKMLDGTITYPVPYDIPSDTHGVSAKKESARGAITVDAERLARARKKLSDCDPAALRLRITGNISRRSADLAAIAISRGAAPSFRADKILTSRIWGLPIMLAFLGILIFITVVGANFFSEQLSGLFSFVEKHFLALCIRLKFPYWLSGILVTGIFRTLGWVIAVMLPPMAIFFPLFTYLEDLGYLPRIAFNLDYIFKKCGSNGKQSLTMCMGLGCNACGVVGARIIRSPRERLIAILTNCFIPCNGRFPLFIAVSSIFFGRMFGGVLGTLVCALIVAAIIVTGIIFTFLVSKLLSMTLLKGMSGEFTMEIPPFRRPNILSVLKNALKKILSLLGRAVLVAAPAGLVLWLFGNIYHNDKNIITIIADFLDPAAKVFGMDGVILLAFFLALPANEIVIPVIIMGYLSTGGLIELSNYSALYDLFIANGWTIITAINVMLFSLLHFPCGTTLITIKKETGSYKWTALGFSIPLITGLLVCALTNGVYLLCTL